ncbi:Ubiquitin carboxyl-terminal hydrolases family 2 [Macleaya cordata]|uniref:Ubiquitin carboxyl-terminal hydrolase n=1 Tax=Macleaya cordata TaxID=56857 RepID=A0A200PYR8_MACCD|nr:Ubiquitin carboxyl-terminal hydrolases family 2 [Macleaya cordata]
MALQMNWQPTLLLQKKRKIGPPLGLKNLGNTCYLNSVLQCLTYTPPLANFCLKNQHTSLCNSDRKRENCPFCILERRIVRSLSLDSPLDVPSKIQSCITIFSDHFRFGRQEDAHEFLRYVIDACHNTCLRINSNNNPPKKTSVVKEIFGGELQSQVKCLSCGAESNKIDEIMDISLDLFQTNSLKDAFQRFFQPEVLDGSNKYKCDKCKKLVSARKQMSILQAPNILVIQLKRFEGIHGGKIDRSIAFEEVLVLSSYMCKGSQDPHPEYNLFGTIVHSGYSPESGHYYAYIKDATGRWYCCNDSHVSLATVQEVLSEKVYILFFSRATQRPKPTKTAIATNGVKSPDCNGNGVSQSSKVALPLKTVTTKPYEANYLEKDRPTISKNGKVSSSPGIKFGNLKSLDSRKVQANGNESANGNIHKPGPVEKHCGLKGSTGVGKIKEDMPSVTIENGANDNKSPYSVYHGSEQTFLVPHGNGQIRSVSAKLVETEIREHNGTGHMAAKSRAPESDHALHNESENSSRCKRKSQDKESQDSLRKDAFWATDNKFKEALAEDASAFLRSCVWHDEVHNFMRSRKRLCTRTAGNTVSNTELKKMLIAEAKQTFITKIPESLKERLIDHLRSFSQGRQFLDA